MKLTGWFGLIFSVDLEQHLLLLLLFYYCIFFPSRAYFFLLQVLSLSIVAASQIHFPYRVPDVIQAPLSMVPSETRASFQALAGVLGPHPKPTGWKTLQLRPSNMCVKVSSGNACYILRLCFIDSYSWINASTQSSGQRPSPQALQLELLFPACLISLLSFFRPFATSQ